LGDPDGQYGASACPREAQGIKVASLALITAGFGTATGGGGSTLPPPPGLVLNIKVSDAFGVGLDEGFAGWDFIAH